MARGPKRHLKRLNAPKHWMLDKLGGVWAPRPSTGPHKLRECLPLIILLRNRLKYALNTKEVKYILMQRLVKVDGKARTDKTYPAGFMGERGSAPEQRRRAQSTPAVGGILEALRNRTGRGLMRRRPMRRCHWHREDERVLPPPVRCPWPLHRAPRQPGGGQGRLTAPPRPCPCPVAAFGSQTGRTCVDVLLVGG